MTAPAFFAPIILILFTACATHRHTVTNTQALDSSTINELLSRITNVSVSESEDFTLILPKNLITSTPCSGTPSTETNESDTIKLQRRSTTYTTIQDTTRSTTTTNEAASNHTEANTRVSHPPDTLTEEFSIPFYLSMIAFLMIIVLIYLPWNLKHRSS